MSPSRFVPACLLTTACLMLSTNVAHAADFTSIGGSGAAGTMMSAQFPCTPAQDALDTSATLHLEDAAEVVLASVTDDNPNGTVNLSVTIPADVAPGTLLALVGKCINEVPGLPDEEVPTTAFEITKFVATFDVVGDVPTSDSVPRTEGGLPDTGSTTSTVVVLASVLLAGGAALLALRRTAMR